MTQRTRIHDAIDLLREGERRKAAKEIRRYMKETKEPGDRWRSIGQLCNKIGEVDLAIECARRLAASPPITLQRMLEYASELATKGRLKESYQEVARLPANIQDHPAVNHLKVVLATQEGEFDKAEILARRTIEQSELTGQNWLSLSMIKKFKPGDKDIAAMERLRPMIDRGPPVSQATFFYALGKAYHDVKDYDRAFDAFSAGAAIMRKEDQFDQLSRDGFAEQVIADYTAENIARLKPSGCDSTRPIFVTGLPRSGTTLVEQIVTSHSAVSAGAEVNLFRSALLPAGNFSYATALAWQEKHPDNADPWGDIARDFLDMLDQRFGKKGMIVDKTLNHSRFMGLILQSLPKARVLWLRRTPADSAISIFRNYFASSMPWSWSLTDIGNYFRKEDELHAHWTALYPDRILTVPYEELVADPESWTRKILAHLELPEEEGVFTPHKQEKRAVMTASVAQVREPISTKQVGAAAAYEKHMKPFFDAYAGKPSA